MILHFLFLQNCSEYREFANHENNSMSGSLMNNVKQQPTDMRGIWCGEPYDLIIGGTSDVHGECAAKSFTVSLLCYAEA